MEKLMRVCVIQMNMLLGKPDYNYAHAEELIQRAAGNTDVIILPEMWNTGFFPQENIKALSDRNGEKTKALMGKLAQDYQVNIVAGSVSDQIAGNLYNSAYIFDRKGNVVAKYDKIHLFSPMGENVVFCPGNNICCFELDGVKCGIIICYDIRFPELARTVALQGIDVLFVVSQWPKVRIAHIDTLTQARAIENQVFLVCANSCGKAGETIYGGHSVLINPVGTIISKAGEEEELIYGTLEFSLLDSVRSTINVYRDRRPDVYQI